MKKFLQSHTTDHHQKACRLAGQHLCTACALVLHQIGHRKHAYWLFLVAFLNRFAIGGQVHCHASIIVIVELVYVLLQSVHAVRPSAQAHPCCTQHQNERCNTIAETGI